MSSTTSEQLEQIQYFWQIVTNFLINYSFQLLGGIVVFVVGLVVAKRVAKLVLAVCQRKDLDITLSQFISGVAKATVLTMVVIVCLNMIGVSVTPFVAAIGALGLGAGLAIQGLLSNFGAGLNIILTRPFVVGDTIKVKSEQGLVKQIRLAYTLLVNEDGVDILVPNRHIIGEILHNSRQFSLLELSVGVAYNSDMQKVISILHKAMQDHDKIAKEPAFQIGIGEFADSCVNIDMRCWVFTDTFFETKYQLNKIVWDTINKHGIDIPFPQRDVNLIQSNLPEIE